MAQHFLDRRKFLLLSSATVLAGCDFMQLDEEASAEPQVPEGAVDPSVTASTYSSITQRPVPMANVGDALGDLVRNAPDGRLWSTNEQWSNQAKGALCLYSVFLG